jgi:hypothetical protein
VEWAKVRMLKTRNSPSFLPFSMARICLCSIFQWLMSQPNPSQGVTRRLTVQGDGEVRRREDLRRRQTKPTTTLFVVNFDVDKTRERDLERHFEPFGKLRRVQIKRNYAFIQYEDVDQAADALKACYGTCLAGWLLCCTACKIL